MAIIKGVTHLDGSPSSTTLRLYRSSGELVEEVESGPDGLYEFDTAAGLYYVKCMYQSGNVRPLVHGPIQAL